MVYQAPIHFIAKITQSTPTAYVTVSQFFKFVTIKTQVWDYTPMEHAYHPNAVINNLHSLQYSLISLIGCINELFLLSYLTCAEFL
jgi:hypothetical protein